MAKKRKPPKKRDRLAEQLVEAALAFHRCRPWQGISNEAGFLIQVPTEDQPLGAVVLGEAGNEFGLSLFRGETALPDLLDMCGWGGPGTEELIDQCSMLSVTFELPGAVPPEFRGILDGAGFVPVRGQVVPYIFSKPSDRRVRPPNRTEMRTLIFALRAVAKAYENGDLQPLSPIGPMAKIHTLVASGSPEDPEVVTIESMVPDLPAIDGGEPPAGLMDDTRDLPRLDVRWLVGLPIIPALMREENRTVRGLLIVDAETLLVVAMPPVFGGDFLDAASRLVEVFCGRHGNENPGPGLPRQIDFASPRLLRFLAPTLEAAGVSCTLTEDTSALEMAASAMAEVLSEAAHAHDCEEWDLFVLPETLLDWKAAEHTLCNVILEDVLDEDLLTEDALNRYFGPHPDNEDIFDDLAHMSPFAAACEWLIADYRPKKRSPTVIEEALRTNDIGVAERALLEARAAAEISIYRVDATEPGVSVCATCILTGQERIIHDEAMSESDGIVGRFIPLRLLRIEEWIFPIIAGPVLSSFQIDGALAHLERGGRAPLTPQRLSKSPELLGHLWRWCMDQRGTTVKLQNTDGDPLEPQTITFTVEDAKSLDAALHARDDVEFDDEGDLWIWFREKPGSAVHERTLLGRLEVAAHELRLSVNSDRRAATARTWLEEISGVRFAERREGDFEPARGGRRGSREPASPAFASEINAFLRQRMMGWLDESIPALGGLTPRAAVKTEDGRSRVRRLIATMPDPGGIPGLVVPREDMLRELGLES